MRRRCSSPAAQGGVWQGLNEGPWVSSERCWVCLWIPHTLRCCIPVPASLEQSCHTLLPFGYWGFSSLNVDEWSPQGLWGAVLLFPSLLGCNSAAAGTCQRCCCLEKLCCSSGMFTELSKPGSGKRENCHELKEKEKGKKAKLFTSTQGKHAELLLSSLELEPDGKTISAGFLGGVSLFFKNKCGFRQVKSFVSRNVRPFPHLCLPSNYPFLVLSFSTQRGERVERYLDVLKHCLLRQCPTG